MISIAGINRLNRIKYIFFVTIYYLLLFILFKYFSYSNCLILFISLPVFYINIFLNTKYALFLNIVVYLFFYIFYRYIIGYSFNISILLLTTTSFIYSLIIILFMYYLKRKNNLKQLELKDSLEQLAVSYRNLESTQTKLLSLTKITKELLVIKNKEKLLDRLLEVINKYLLYEDIAFFSYDGNNLSLKKMLGFKELDKDFLHNLANRFCGAELKEVQIISLKKQTFNNKNYGDRGSRLLLIPVNTGNKLEGIILVLSNSELIEEEDKDLIGVLTDQLGLMLKNIELLENTRYLAITDNSTGLYNQRYFYEMLKEKFSHAQKYQIPISIIILDIDNFKNINDNHGHLFGDKVLAEIADLLKENIRDKDILARYGGEEFGIILPGANCKIAYQIADRMRKIIEKHEFKNFNNQTVKTTISGGVASFPDFYVDNPIQLVEIADRALYRSKNRGKNKVYYAKKKFM